MELKQSAPLYSRGKNVDLLNYTPKRKETHFLKKFWKLSKNWIGFTFVGLISLAYFDGIENSLTYIGWTDIIIGTIVFSFGVDHIAIITGIDNEIYDMDTIDGINHTILSDFFMPIIGLTIGFTLLSLG